MSDSRQVNCPYCSSPISEREEVHECPACRARHHDECWQENGGCAITGCSIGPPATQPQPPQSAPLQRLQVEIPGDQPDPQSPLPLQSGFQARQQTQPGALPSVQPTPSPPKASQCGFRIALAFLLAAVLFAGGVAACVSTSCLRSASATTATQAATGSASSTTAQRPVIEPQVGMLGVNLGDSVATVMGKLGTPDSDEIQNMEIQGKVEILDYGGTRFFAPVSTAKVSTIETTSSDPQTPAGVSVGSSSTEVEASYPNIKCESYSGKKYCNLGSGDIGSRFTSFQLGGDDLVYLISIGYVID